MGCFSCFGSSASIGVDPAACHDREFSHQSNLVDHSVDLSGAYQQRSVSVLSIQSIQLREEVEPLSSSNAEILHALLPFVSDCGTFGKLLGTSRALSASVLSWSESRSQDEVPPGDALFDLCHRCKDCSIILLDAPAPSVDDLEEGQAPPPPAAQRCFPGEMLCTSCGTPRNGYGRISRAAALHEHGLSECQAARLRFVWVKPNGGGGRVALVLERDVLAIKVEIEREFHLALEATEATMMETAALSAPSPRSARLHGASSNAASMAPSAAASRMPSDGGGGADTPSAAHVPHYASPRQRADSSAHHPSPRQRGNLNAAMHAALGGDIHQAMLSSAALPELAPEQQLASQAVVDNITKRVVALADLLREEIRKQGRQELLNPAAVDYVGQAVHFGLRRALLSIPVATMLRRLHPYAAAGCLTLPSLPSAAAGAQSAPSPGTPRALKSIVSSGLLVDRALGAAVAHYERLKPQLLKDAMTVAKRSSAANPLAGRRPEALGLEAFRRLRSSFQEFATELGAKQADRMQALLDDHLRGAGPSPGAAPGSGSASPVRRPATGLSPAQTGGVSPALRRSGGWNNNSNASCVIVRASVPSPAKGGREHATDKWGSSPVKAHGSKLADAAVVDTRSPVRA